jgi:RimJ/RimL family protein N-acetyltransferase
MPERGNMSESPIHLRAIQTNDVKAYQHLRLEGLKLYPKAFSSDYADQAARPMDFWVQRVSSACNSPDQIIYLAETPAGLVGTAGLVRGESPKERHNALLVGIYVKTDYQGQGLAEKLITACLDWGHSQGIQIVKLGVGAYNTAAIRLYQRLGFVQYGNEPKALWVDGEYLDEWQMAKEL